MLAVPTRQVFRAYQPGEPRVGEPPGFCQRCGTPCVIADCDGRGRPPCRSCGYVVFRNPASAVAIVILRDGHVLLGSLHALVVTVAAKPVGGVPDAGDDLCELSWVPIGGPLPSLAYEGDAYLLERLAHGAVPLLPVDMRYAVPR
jgi:ribosomal protein S27AE